ncbi:butyrophilin subfamily 2 member A2-like [Pelobates cultripes]|uniref:Butyrophilin subfamily 2 member A2-like n=1 Tax=Pelobates cultripes TaxID=61616 RepID=A0AAD1TIW4_PELCU|nr:butyrophilin subfamily 2 member A2-like [Pelobates cultripes]
MVYSVKVWNCDNAQLRGLTGKKQPQLDCLSHPELYVSLVKLLTNKIVLVSLFKKVFMMLQNRLTNHSSYLLILLLFLSQIQRSLSDRFTVIATKTPISATIGSDVTLSFHLSPEINAENMEIGISRSPSTEFAFLYRRGQEVTGSQIKGYKGRTKLVTEHLKMGEISLLIRDVGPFDNGIYYCFVQSDNYYNENSLELILTMLGTGPVIRITDKDKGITAVCESNGWYPKPTVLWKDSLGKPLDNSNESSTEDESRLLSVYSLINVNPNNPTFCNFRSVLLNIQNQPGIRISDTLYNRVDRCFTSLIFISAVLLSFTLPIMYGLYKVRTLKAKLKETDNRLRKLLRIVTILFLFCFCNLYESK